MSPHMEGCQIPSVPKIAEDAAAPTGDRSLVGRFKAALAYPWNRYVKNWLKRGYAVSVRQQGGSPQQAAAKEMAPSVPFVQGERVRVRSREEIQATLDPFKELRGCAFLPEMYEYCGTEQRVFRVMQRFMDERDYKLKKVRGVILLENVFCSGTPVFGPCDRSCLLFWREEWLERLPE